VSITSGISGFAVRLRVAGRRVTDDGDAAPEHDAVSSASGMRFRHASAWGRKSSGASPSVRMTTELLTLSPSSPKSVYYRLPTSGSGTANA
jgi:hypothetical protein